MDFEWRSSGYCVPFQQGSDNIYKSEDLTYGKNE
nr:MAG TPA: hypothetical protein [Bacteriophage sp.]